MILAARAGQAAAWREAESPSATEVRAAVERMTHSAPLCASPRLVAFLRYVVERALAGQGAWIKSYTIAVEALGRDPSFDPEADSIVRVEAGRLRHALAQYYAGIGRNEELLIALPRGSYVPVFARAGEPTALRSLLERLGDLRRQLAAIATEIESTQTLLERAAQVSRPLD
jgi:hypothetical protein